MRHQYRDRFPRTMTEAFGCDATSAQWISKKYTKPAHQRVYDWLTVAAVGLTFGFLFAAFV